MSEDTKRSHDKKKHDPKDQRKPRLKHQQNEKKHEKKPEDKTASKVPVVPPQKPVYESPPPEFFKNLKRETDEILKITEEESTKYKKKEIQSNWSKYEMPIESYDEMEEQENMGADYEKLIQAPLSVGGHFQFKHEKSWDINTAPSLYDEYFNINMADLNLAISSIPFYERNNIDKTEFSESDILNMDSRATRYKQKYFNDKSYSTPETEAYDKILSTLEGNKNDKTNSSNNDTTEINYIVKNDEKDIDLKSIPAEHTNTTDDKSRKTIENTEVIENKTSVKHKLLESNVDELKLKVSNSKLEDYESKVPAKEPTLKDKKTTAVCNAAKNNPVIESPEDLEKWLDDFLDG